MYILSIIKDFKDFALGTLMTENEGENSGSVQFL